MYKFVKVNDFGAWEFGKKHPVTKGLILFFAFIQSISLQEKTTFFTKKKRHKECGCCETGMSSKKGCTYYSSK